MADTGFNIPLFGAKAEFIFYDVDPSQVEFLSSEVEAEAKRLEKIFNIYDDTSELSHLNRRRKALVSDELMHVLNFALSLSEETGGRYDISKGREFLERKHGKAYPSPGASYTDIIVKGNEVDIKGKDAYIDLGSVAKGYIGDMLCKRMEDLGLQSGYIDARGDIRIFGDHVEVVEIQHPRNMIATVYPFVLDNMAVATSGDYRQYHGSFDNSHIIGKSNVASVTVIGPTLMEADAVATCLMVLGKEEGSRFLDKRRHLMAFMIDTDLNEHFMNGFKRLMVLKNGK